MPASHAGRFSCSSSSGLIVLAAVVAAGGIPTRRVAAADAATAAPIRVVIWDERQPEQKRAYDDFLGNEIAARLGRRPGIELRSVALDDAEQGLAPEILDWGQVLVWWSHRRNQDVPVEKARQVAARVLAGRMMFVGLHSAHWARPFTELMDARARQDVRRQFAEVPPGKLVITEVPGPRKVPPRDARLTPATDVDRRPDGTVAVTLHLPGCIFPAFRNDGKPSTVRLLDRGHPLAAGLPEVFTLPQTEMYDEPYHVPAPDTVVAEETWEAGERFRSVLVWRVGAGRVVYIRPGHETFPVWKDDRMLRLLENAIRWQREPAEDARGAAAPAAAATGAAGGR
jgi:trehalose utilization protein